MTNTYSEDPEWNNNDTASDPGIPTTVSNIYAETIDKLFFENPWLEMYYSKRELLTYPCLTKNSYITNINKLSDEFRSLCPDTDDPQLRSVILYMVSNPEGDLRLKTVSDRFLMNNTYLSTVFNTKFGIHYTDYLTRIKIKRLRYLLVHTDECIGSIIRSLGRNQLGYFSKLFKKFYGYTPIEYRQRYCKTSDK